MSDTAAPAAPTGFFRIATADPDRDALVAPDGTELTAGELHGLANQIATACGPSASSPATPSPWCCPTASRCSQPTSAGTQIGCYVTPINHHLVGPEIAYIVNDSEAKVFVGHERFADELDQGHGRARGDGPRVADAASPSATVDGLPALRRADRRPARPRRPPTASPARRCTTRRAPPASPRA